MTVSLRKVDYKRESKALFTAGRQPTELDVPPLRFLAIDGVGSPYATGYEQAVEALFAVSYAAKFQIRNQAGLDYGVLPLQTLWHTKDDSLDQERWQWTAMIMQPPPVTEEVVAEARATARGKKELPAEAGIRLYDLTEGRAVQVLHVGPYDAEAPTIGLLHEHITEQRLSRRGAHHEIYLNSPGRTAPEKLRTIIRQPVE